MIDRIAGIVRTFLFKVPRPFDPRSDESSAVTEPFITDLFEACCDEASIKLQAKGFTPGVAATRCYMVYASDFWAEAAAAVNGAKIPIVGGQPPFLELDDRGFLMAVLQMPEEERRELTPIINEFVEEEMRLHPEYITGESSNKQPEIRLTTAQFEDIVSVDKLLERQLLAAYFETYGMLQIYRGMHDYDDPKAKDLAVRMELILRRMEEDAHR